MATTIKYIDWDDQKRADNDARLCEVVGSLKKVANAKYGVDDVRRLRTDFVQGSVPLKGEERTLMGILLSFESDYLGAYIRQICQMANAFYLSFRREHPQLEEDDYIQEGTMALINAMYHYNGQSAFTTLLHASVKRALMCYVREERDPISGVSRDIRELRRKVVRRMKRDRIGFDEAVTSLRNEGENITELAEAKVADAIFKTITLAIDVSSGGNVSDDVDVERIRMALDHSGLTDLERELIVAYMEDNQDIRREISENRINEKTGNLYTKQSLSQTFIRGCAKIREFLEEREAQYAA